MPAVRSSLLLVLVSALVLALGAAPSRAPGAVAQSGAPQLESFTINAPLVDFLYTIVGGETFTVTLRLDRPSPAGGTRVLVRKLRDSGPIYTLPKEAVIPQGARSRTFTVETLPIARGDRVTPSNQQLAGSIVSVENPDVLFGSVFIVPRPVGDPRGDPVTYEAENGRLSGARVVSDAGPWSLASNEAFVVYTSSTGSVELDAQARAGTNLVVFRYAYFGDESRLMRVTINGTARLVTFQPTPGESWYQLTAIRADLRAGANTIRISAVRRSPPVNLDFLQVAVP
jgi:hypothetical protein